MDQSEILPMQILNVAGFATTMFVNYLAASVLSPT